MQTGFDAKAELLWVMKNLVGKDEERAEFWLAACQQQIGNAAAYVDAVAVAKRKADDAARKKKERKKKPKEISDFKDWLQCLWVPAALWCNPSPETNFCQHETARCEQPDCNVGRFQRSHFVEQRPGRQWLRSIGDDRAGHHPRLWDADHRRQFGGG